MIFLKNVKQFVPFLVCGYPNFNINCDIIKLILDEGIDIIELGIPFSDPIADGPTIQNASFVSLSKGFKIEDVFKLLEITMSYKSYTPVLMTYLNPILVYGIERFLKKISLLGVKGIIFADVIVEEKDIFYSLTNRYGIYNIFLLSSTTEKKRRHLIYKYCNGFIYLLTLSGTTGARKVLPLYFYDFVKIIRKETKKPIYAGFGISSPKQVLPIIDYIDGFIVGSKIIDTINKNSFQSLRKVIKSFLSICK